MAKSTPAYGRAKFKTVLNLNGSNYEMSQVSTDFSLNAIPQASCAVAVGRDVRSLKAAAINTAGQPLSIMTPATITLEASGDFSPTEQWPSGQQTIFQGYLTGSAYRKVGGNTQMVLNLTHWLSDLSYSTMLSESSHPGNPWNYTYSAVRRNPGAGASTKASLLSQTKGSNFFNLDNIGNDLFGSAILPYFKYLCENDTMLTISGRLASTGCVPASPRNNAAAIAALNLFETSKPWNVPLAINLGGAGTELAGSIAQGIIKLLDDGAYFQSMWDNLVGILAPQFMFGIVPRVSGALVAPIIPGLQKTYSRTIQDTDQDYVELQAQIPRLVRGVGVMSSMRSGMRSNVTQVGQDPGVDVGLGGCFVANDANGKPLTQGTFLVIQAPAWLSQVHVATTNVGKTVGPNSATTPNASGPKVDPSPADIIRQSKQVFDNYAKAYYLSSVLQGRQGVVSGKLRYDIAPGTNVFVEGTSDKFLGDSDKLGQDLTGMVTRVSCTLNSEQSKAATGFNIAYARTEAENAAEQTSVQNHPLYQGAFVGAPLVDAYAMTS